MGAPAPGVRRVQGPLGRRLTGLRERLLLDPDPTWTRAPTALLRAPSVVAALAAAGLALAVAGSTAPLFEASVGSAALSHEIARSSRWSAGLSVVAFGPLSGPSGAGSQSAEDLFRRRDSYLRRQTSGAPGLGSAVVTVLGSVATLVGPDGQRASVQLLSRTGFLAHVHRLSGSGSGLWLADTTATRTGARPGGFISLRSGDHRATVPIAGVYRDLTAAPLSGYWAPVHDLLADAGSTRLPAPLLMDLGSFRRLAGKLPQVARFTWQFPLATTHVSLARADQTAGQTSALATALETPDDPEVQALFQQTTAQAGLPDLIARARRTQATVKGPVEAVGVAGRVVALLVVAAAGLYATNRRRPEVALLSVRGVTPSAQGGRAALHALGPVFIGSVVGWLAGSWLVSALGPGGAIDPSARRGALTQVIVGAALALVLLAAVGWLSAREGGTVAGSSIGRTLAQAPWELLVLVLAAGSYYEVLVHGSSGDQAGATQSVDVFLLLFPILFVVGGAGVTARVVGRLLPRLRSRGRGGAAVFLAARRLASASALGMLLVAGTAAGVGVLVYAAVAASSTDATNLAKARLLTGGDVRVTLAPNTTVRTVPPGATQVARVDGASLLPADESVDVIAVDPATFLRAVYWRSDFADAPPTSLLEQLGPWNGRIPLVIARGTIPAGGVLSLSGLSLPVRSVARVSAFPGMAPGRPLVVLSAPELKRYLERQGMTLGGIDGGNEVWGRGARGPLLQRLLSSGANVSGVRTAAEVRNTTTFLSLSWTLGYLEALGVMAALVALAGILLYLQALQRSREISYALASRMGLSRSAHRSSVALELSGMLAIALAAGVGLALVAALLVLSRLDLVPQIPPAPFLTIPVGVIIALGLFLLVVAVAGAWWVQRTADHARVAEVIRLAV